MYMYKVNYLSVIASDSVTLLIGGGVDDEAEEDVVVAREGWQYVLNDSANTFWFNGFVR